MLAKEEYYGFFEEISKVEHQMVEVYAELEKIMIKEKCIEIIKKIKKEEEMHSKLSNRLMEIAEKYC